MEEIGFREYQKLAMRTCKAFDRREDAIANVGLGLTGECGEVADVIKKHLCGGKELDKQHLQEELGDILWYIAEACEVFDIDFLQVAQGNIEKLMKRYPKGFDSNAIR